MLKAREILQQPREHERRDRIRKLGHNQHCGMRTHTRRHAHLSAGAHARADVEGHEDERVRGQVPVQAVVEEAVGVEARRCEVCGSAMRVHNAGKARTVGAPQVGAPVQDEQGHGDAGVGRDVDGLFAWCYWGPDDACLGGAKVNRSGMRVSRVWVEIILEVRTLEGRAG